MGELLKTMIGLLVTFALVAMVDAHGMMHPPSYLLDEFLSHRRGPLPPQQYPGDLPKEFDTRKAFPGCIAAGGILNQGQCGSCWAFASTEVLSDRFCIESHGAVNVTLSPENALGCETLHWGCKMGSMPEWAWPFLVKHGVATMDCVPYTAGNGTAPHHCETQCASGGAMTMYHAVNFTHAGDFFDASKHTAAIMRALMSGPLDATFIVYEDFMEYQAGQ